MNNFCNYNYVGIVDGLHVWSKNNKDDKKIIAKEVGNKYKVAKIRFTNERDIKLTKLTNREDGALRSILFDFELVNTMEKLVE